MLYPKNVPNIERIIRLALGVALIGLALFGQPLIGESSPLRIGILLLSAAFVIVTGFVGWCPACALIGRKIKATQRRTADEN